MPLSTRPLAVGADSTDIPAEGAQVTIGIEAASGLIFHRGGGTS
jgi:hypothetical protein